MTEDRLKAVKDISAQIISDKTNTNFDDVRKWLETVNTAEDFFGKDVQGLKEYENFITMRENDYNNTVKRTYKKRG